jgi:RNA polymerase sigma-70 factor (ECF subfamily)
MSTETVTAASLFEQIYADNFVRVCKAVNRMMKDSNAQLCEDIAQEVFADIWRQLSAGRTFDEPERMFSLLAWLAQRKLSQYYAKLASQRELLFGVSHAVDGSGREVQIEASEADAGITPVDVATQVTERISMGAVLAMLPPTQRRAVALHVVEDMSIEAVAEETGYAPRTVKAHYGQGLTTLRQALGVAPRTAQDDAKAARERARKAFLDSVKTGSPLAAATLANRFGLSESWARLVIKDAGYQRPAAAQDRIAESVRAGLLGGRWAPGARIEPKALAAQFEVTDNTVLKVLRVLVDEGRIETRPRAPYTGVTYHAPGATTRHLSAVA